MPIAGINMWKCLGNITVSKGKCKFLFSRAICCCNYPANDSLEKVLCELPQAGSSGCHCNTGPCWSPGQPGTCRWRSWLNPKKTWDTWLFTFLIKNPPRIVYKVGFVIWRVKGKVMLRVLGKKRVGTRIIHAEYGWLEMVTNSPTERWGLIPLPLDLCWHFWIITSKLCRNGAEWWQSFVRRGCAASEWVCWNPAPVLGDPQGTCSGHMGVLWLTVSAESSAYFQHRLPVTGVRYLGIGPMKPSDNYSLS